MISNKTGFIGVGNMAGAILDGMIGSGVQKPEDIVLYDICPEKAQRFVDMGCNMAQSEQQLAEMCDTIILAIKPQGFSKLLGDIREQLTEDKLVISIAAGISIDFINECVGKNLSVIRVLPNTPMLFGLGVSAITYRPPVTADQYEFACRIFNSCGSVYFVNEDMFNQIICVHSSSPAYVFLMIKAMADNAVQQGIEREQAMKMITGTFIGAAKMVEQSDLSCDQLIQMVASKGGTTEASLRSFEQDSFCEIVGKAMNACTQRAVELGKKE